MDNKELPYEDKPLQKALVQVQRLKENDPTLTTLHLSGLSFRSYKKGRHGLARTLAQALANNTTLTYLSLSSCGLAYDDDAQDLAVLTESLCKNTTLTILDLGENCMVEAASVLYLPMLLEKNTTLITLDLRGNSIGKKGAKALAQSLTKNTTLKTLDLSWNALCQRGAGKALAECLPKNTTLTTLVLSHNKIDLVDQNALVDALQYNTSLTTLAVNFTSTETRMIVNAILEGNRQKI